LTVAHAANAVAWAGQREGCPSRLRMRSRAGAGSRYRLPGSRRLADLRQAARAGTTPGPWIPP